MDLDGLFWIALLVFYFVARTIGGGKRSNQTGKRQPQEARGDTSRGGTDELSGALDEIRRALGYPDAEEVEEVEKVETSTAKGTQQWTKEQHSEKRTAKAPTGPRTKSRTKSHTKSRTRSTSIKKRSRPEVGDKIVPGLPALTSSFSEEETFERVGRHPHRATRHDLRVVSPYEKPARKQLPGLRRRLTNRASLREAFLVKEILDRPVSMRRR